MSARLRDVLGWLRRLLGLRGAAPQPGTPASTDGAIRLGGRTPAPDAPPTPVLRPAAPAYPALDGPAAPWVGSPDGPPTVSAPAALAQFGAGRWLDGRTGDRVEAVRWPDQGPGAASAPDSSWSGVAGPRPAWTAPPTAPSLPTQARPAPTTASSEADPGTAPAALPGPAPARIAAEGYPPATTPFVAAQPGHAVTSTGAQDVESPAVGRTLDVGAGAGRTEAGATAAPTTSRSGNTGDAEATQELPPADLTTPSETAGRPVPFAGRPGGESARPPAHGPAAGEAATAARGHNSCVVDTTQELWAADDHTRPEAEPRVTGPARIPTPGRPADSRPFAVRSADLGPGIARAAAAHVDTAPGRLGPQQPTGRAELRTRAVLPESSGAEAAAVVAAPWPALAGEDAAGEQERWPRLLDDTALWAVTVPPGTDPDRTKLRQRQQEGSSWNA
ncbi:hypothetical protein Cba03nite_40420 [Catellatospora bangladeshensis]|uniref:Uncharacterized protein n=1 Tax=Catellatospora bangladeshensis TaxID=310355 RepID=A0A8J3NK53_9ACTN|nr:hypothetical protein Cba03nite_40420 [Catellatospora bangladeshensis]